MSFRRRTVMLAAGAVAAAVVIASVVVYFVTRSELLGEIDLSLRQKPSSVVYVQEANPKSARALEHDRKMLDGALPALGVQIASSGSASSASAGESIRSAGASQHGPVQTAGGPLGAGEGSSVSRSESVTAAVHQPKGAKTETVVIERKTVKLPRGTLAGALPGLGAYGRLQLPTKALGGATGYVQLVSRNGQLLHSEGHGSGLPVTTQTREVAEGKRGSFFSDLTVAGTPVRMFTEAAGEGSVWQAALPLSDFDGTLSRLRLVLALVCLGGIALAVAFGLLVSRAALVPVRRLTRAAERVARTQDLGHRIRAGRDDDLGRLAESFNTMLAALERSRLSQRQLVSDASHELRTPITSVQANLDALALGDRLSPAERARIVDAVQAQLGELTVLVGDLVDLSKTEVEELEIEDVRLDLAVSAAILRSQLHAPDCQFVLDASPCLVRAAPARLDRAIANLLDNACQWGRHAPIEVRVRDGAVEVRDRGPGIAEEDLPRVFDRFYRAATARSRPGSGLGLAIVRQAAESHGGTVHAANAPGGGARLTLELPVLALTDGELRACANEASRTA
jgi:two-component system, OmpR family, sensor histidine kinase MprB